MKRTLLSCILTIFPVFLLGSEPEPSASVSREFRNAAQARIDSKYVLIVNKDGSKNLVPVSNLKPADLEWLKEVSEHDRLKKSQSTVVVTAEAAVESNQSKTKKETIVVSKIENGVETVQLCGPNVFYEQIGGTCMLYARVHWLDIAGYYSQWNEIVSLITGAPPNAPWNSPKYVNGLSSILYDRPEKPKLHQALSYGNNFNWARKQLRMGRPILAALPREIWQALPSDFVASAPWSGGSVGHQIVVNGFTYDSRTNSGTFHVVNSWSGLSEFDINLKDARNGNLVFEHSMSPYGEVIEKEIKTIVESVTLIKEVGGSGLYLVKTNKGAERIVAPNEATARRLALEDK